MHENFSENQMQPLRLTRSNLIKALSYAEYSELSFSLQATIKVMLNEHILKARLINHGLYYHYLLVKYVSKMV